MSGPVFVRDADGTPLMPTSPAYARKLLKSGKGTLCPHHAFTVVQLNKAIPKPALRPIIACVAIHLNTAEIFIVADSGRRPLSLLRLIVDLRTDLTWRIRRRANHRGRRKSRQRYHGDRQYRRAYKLRRPSLARSRWAAGLRRRSVQGRDVQRGQGTHTLRWRAEAIARTIAALQKLLPLSHVVLISPLQLGAWQHVHLSAAERWHYLVERDGVDDGSGRKVARCAYCGTHQSPIEVDHILPRSRGGTDAWENLTLACAKCNERKGDRTPDEAGMRLLISIERPPSSYPRRAQAYMQETSRLLFQRLRSSSLVFHWAAYSGHWPKDLNPLLTTTLGAAVNRAEDMTDVVVKPVSRPRKQHFTARNYSLRSPIGRGYQIVGTTIKRRVRTNESLQLTTDNIVRIGMLCKTQRAGRTVSGLVAAIHSDGRIGLDVLVEATAQRVSWRRVVVSPRQNFRILATQRVVFMSITLGETP